MKTKVATCWYNQEIRAFDWQIKEEPRLISLTESRIKNVKNGGKNSADCSLEYLENLLIRITAEKGDAQKRKDVFMLTYEPCDEIRPDKKGAELFIRQNAKNVKNAHNGSHFGYYSFLSTVAMLFGLCDRNDSVIDWYFRIIDSEQNN